MVQFRKALNLGCLAVLAVGLPAWAASPSYIEEVVVTAQHKAQDVQQVPIAITAFSENQLEAIDFQTNRSLNGFAPNLHVTQDFIGSNNARISIRGQVQGESLPTFDPPVGLYLDGVYVARTPGSLFELTDVERIEVLNGPQGTLYGRNTTGGLINVISNKPTDELEIKLSTRFHDYSGVNDDLNQQYGAVINLPLTETTGARVSIQWTDDDGFAADDGNDQIGPGNQALSWRGVFEWQASDDLEFTLVTDGTDAETDGVIGHIRSLEPNTIAFFESFAGPLGLAVQTESPTKVTLSPMNVGLGGGKPFSENNSFGIGLTTEWSLADNLLVRNILGYRDADTDSATDCDNSATPYLCQTRTSDPKQEQFSAEIQLIYNNQDGNLELQLGGYYLDEDNEQLSQSFALFQYLTSATIAKTESKAVYGHLTFHATDRFELVGGVRQTWEDKEATNFVQAGFTPGDVCDLSTCPQVFNGDDSWSPFTWDVGANFYVSDDWFLFAKIAKGFKSGGIDVRDPFGSSYDPEEVVSYEIGSKYSFANGRGYLNASLFYADTQDAQRLLNSLVVVGTAVIPAQVVRNVADMDVVGGELELAFAPTESLTLRATLGVTHAEYDGGFEFGGTTLDMSDQDVNYTPEVNASWLVQYRLGGTALYQEAQIKLSGYWFDDQVFELFNKPPLNVFETDSIRADSYAVTNVSLDFYDVGAEGLDVSLFASNVFDEDYLVLAQDLRNIGFGFTYGFYGPPRSIGLKLDYQL